MPRTLLINSTLAAIIGTTIMVFLHECAHFLTPLALGHSASLSAFAVTHSEDIPTHTALIAAAGPIFSLLSGIICSLLQPRRLVWIWFSFASIMEGVCYFVITPAGAGDTATVVDALGWPAWVQLVMCAVGVAGMFATAWHFAPYIKRFAGDDRKAQWAMAFWPWLIGAAAMYR
ncbi:hypothetical protein HMPREF2724_02335 [Corynebacterium sp. HMSC071F07]|uniref:hypothetical protein n=1 Tax=Corynebacterium sp. HMSC071F07 TaxID=1715203 RepID=UPI0008A18BBF|nr:hypothetical protein [Corynebacterium sp. HMSC071F07]OFM04506.1 hypothetical protein HMPREF2724_02335 [Corynebacterium sp. HMSC071F07]